MAIACRGPRCCSVRFAGAFFQKHNHYHPKRKTRAPDHMGDERTLVWCGELSADLENLLRASGWASIDKWDADVGGVMANEVVVRPLMLPSFLRC